MKKAIETFTTTTGWTSNGTIAAYALNQYPDYISGLNSTSLIIRVPSGNLNKYIQKTVSPAVDVTGYNEIVFYVWSRELGDDSFRKIADFSYKIDLGTGTEYYIPTFKGFNCVSIRNAGTSVNNIKITSLHDVDDYILFSDMNAIKEEMPLDIYVGIKEAIEAEIDVVYPIGKQIGTVTCSAGVSQVTLSADDYVDRYCVLEFNDTVHREQHQVWEFDEQTVKFTTMYDGASMLNTFAAAHVYLTYPVEYAVQEKEAVVPGIIIYGGTPDRVWRGSGLEDIEDSHTSAGAYQRREGAIEKFQLSIHCYARHGEVLAFLSRMVRNVINKQALWINGSYHEMNYEGTPTAEDPTQVYDLIPVYIFNVSVEVKEELYARTSAIKVTTTTTTITPEGATIL